MGSLFFRKCLAWLIVAFFLLLLPTFVHANIALTGKSFQAIINNENIVGYELSKQYNPYPGGSIYSYQGKPIYYDPYMPEAARTIQSQSSAPYKYGSTVKVKDLLSPQSLNGKTIVAVPEAGTAAAMTGAKAIAKKALTGLPGIILTELVSPETLSDGTIAASGYELGKISDSNDSDITVAELKARIAQNKGIDVSSTPADEYDVSDGKVTKNGVTYTLGSHGDRPGPIYPVSWGYVITDPALAGPYGIYVFYAHAYDGSGYYDYYSWAGGTTYAPATGFDPANYPQFYANSEGVFNAVSDLVANDASVEMIPLDPSLMPTYFPDSDTGFMRFAGHTEVGNQDYLIGPDWTAVLSPPGVTWSAGFPYVDPASIGYIAENAAPGGQSTFIPGSISGIPAGSTILSVDPKTGMIKFRTPEGSESYKYGTVEEIQSLQNKVSAPYYDANGQPMTYGSSSTNSSTSTNSTTIVSNREDYSVNIPDLPGVPAYPHEFEVPTPDPWPWQDWVNNPFGAMLNSMEITASGSPYIDFPIDFPFYPAFTIRGDFSVYSEQLETIGAFGVAFAYVMAVLIVVRAKN